MIDREAMGQHLMHSDRKPDQFLALLEPIKDSVYRYARRIAWNDDQVNDIVQEAVMTAWREFERFELNTNFKAWVFRILINTAFRLNKRYSRRRSMTLDETVVDLSQVLERESAWDSLLNDREKLNQLLDDRLVTALDRLSVDERECLLLRLLDEFSYKEISATLDMPLGTVMSHVHRARAKLREQLATLAIDVGLVREATQ